MNGPGLLVAACAALTIALPVAADGGPRIDIEVSVEREQVRLDEQGRRIVERQPVEAVHPGDVLVYTLRAVNRGDQPALNARIDDPVPEGTRLILEALDELHRPSAGSIDGGTSWQPFPVMVRGVGEDGAPRRVPAPAERYTHLRWQLAALAPGESRSIELKVEVR